MCDPVTGTVTLSSTAAWATIVATGMSINSQRQMASYQAKQNDKQYDNAIKAMDANVNQTNLEHMQERESAMQKLEQNNLQAEAAQASARVAAGENGVGGVSVGALLDDLSMKQTRFNSSVTTNYQNAEMALNNQRENAGINASNVINGLKTPMMPDYATAGLQILNASDKLYGKKQ